MIIGLIEDREWYFTFGEISSNLLIKRKMDKRIPKQISKTVSYSYNSPYVQKCILYDVIKLTENANNGNHVHASFSKKVNFKLLTETSIQLFHGI